MASPNGEPALAILLGRATKRTGPPATKKSAGDQRAELKQAIEEFRKAEGDDAVDAFMAAVDLAREVPRGET